MSRVWATKCQGIRDLMAVFRREGESTFKKDYFPEMQKLPLVLKEVKSWLSRSPVHPLGLSNSQCFSVGKVAQGREFYRIMIYSCLWGMCVYEHMLVNYINVCVHKETYNIVILFKVNACGRMEVAMENLCKNFSCVLWRFKNEITKSHWTRSFAVDRWLLHFVLSLKKQCFLHPLDKVFLF